MGGAGMNDPLDNLAWRVGLAGGTVEDADISQRTAALMNNRAEWLLAVAFAGRDDLRELARLRIIQGVTVPAASDFLGWTVDKVRWWEVQIEQHLQTLGNDPLFPCLLEASGLFAKEFGEPRTGCAVKIILREEEESAPQATDLPDRNPVPRQQKDTAEA